MADSIPNWEELSDIEGELADHYRDMQKLLTDALTVETTLKKQISVLSERNTELERRLEIADPDGETIDMIGVSYD